MSQTRYKYTPDEMPQNQFLKQFVIRGEVFDEIFDELKEADYSVANQHYIMVGQRGQGKTTLLRKLKIEIEEDKKLSPFLIPIKFAEEQYNIRELCRLWEEIASYLQLHYEELFEDISDEIEKHIEEENYDTKCFSYLERNLKKSKKKLILLIDNIDEFLEKLKKQEQHQLREILLTSSSFIIVGASTKMIEQHYDYAKPFYEFFKIINLETLTFDESIALLQAVGDREQQKKIELIIKNKPQRIETLRRITGGVPRTVIMLFDIFIQENENAFDDLMKILDEVTPLYKDRMDKLPNVLQEITHTIALNWDGMLTKEIAKKTRLESKVVSAQVKQLEKYQIIESKSLGKNKIYFIKERFFNIWYLMRYGRKKDRNRVEWLIQFLLSWYERDELESKAKSFISILKKNSSNNEHYSYYLCEALSYTGCLELETEYNLKKELTNFLEKNNSSLSKEVSMSNFNKLNQLYSENRFKDMIKILLKFSEEKKVIIRLLGELYDKEEDYKNAEKYYHKAIDIGEHEVLINLANLYFIKKEYEKAEAYYLKAIESGNNGALNNLALFYFLQNKSMNKAIDLAKKSYDNDKDIDITHTLSIILLWAEDFAKSYEKILECLKYDDTKSEKLIILYLNLLISKGQYYKAKEFLEMPKYELKERYKPIWYALMSLMQDEFPHEIKKMGSELKETVDEVLEEIERLRKKYSV